jgi:DNA-binding response OmpR family regulator
MKIVVAEHDGTLRQALEAGRAPAGDEVRVVEARAGVVEAVIAADVPQVLVLDWSAPGLAAADLCASIRRRDPAEPYLFVVAVVPDDRPGTRAEAYRAGVDSVVARPVDPFELLARLDVARRIAGLQDALLDRSMELERARLDLESRNAMLAEIASTP